MKKSYSVALGWWAARWLIHLGVYKYLEEQNIEIEEISGTSMWAIIASFIANWKSYDEMLDFAKNINYLNMIDTDFNLWFLKWEKILNLLEGVFWDKKIEDSIVPLKITATNLDNWTLKIFTKWKIVDALRASFAIPWIFSPKIINWTHYIDWWIIMNLPVQALDWENILAISALKINYSEIIKTKEFLWLKFKTWFFENNFEILNRSLSLLMKTNEDISLLTVWKNIKLVRPNFWELDALDFNKLDKFIELGYEAIKEIEL